MQKFILINPQAVYSIDPPGFCTLESLPGRIKKGSREPVLIGIVPAAVGRVLATERTLDSAMPQQYPGPNSFSVEPLSSNVYQVYVAPDALLAQLRALARDVRVVPYPAAVRAALAGNKRGEPTFIERTRVFLGTTEEEAVNTDDQVALDPVGDEFLITALRGKEILAVRLAQGEPTIELQRTFAANRMENPPVATKDEALALELAAQGLKGETSDLPGVFLGEAGLEKVAQLRFLNEMEAAQQRAAAGRRRAVAVLAASMLVPLLGAASYVYFEGRRASAENEGQGLTMAKSGLAFALAGLYQERYGALARKESLQIREELYDLSISLPPQVALLSVQKDAQGISAVVERRPGAAPFAIDDLRAALHASPFFADATIQEQYEGHVVRYVLSKFNPPPGLPPASPSPQGP